MPKYDRPYCPFCQSEEMCKPNYYLIKSRMFSAALIGLMFAFLVIFAVAGVWP